MMTMLPKIETPLGRLYEADCLEVMRRLPDESLDLIFADPPFNLGKEYTSKFNDRQKDIDYLNWCRVWSDELARLIKPGGSLFIWNLPKWNLTIGGHLSDKLSFRHWIAVDIKYSLPIQKRLYPSHYSLLYFVKGSKPSVFHPDRLPTPCCRHCGGELRDYGGYKDKMNPKGVNLSDVWTDIPPVRHRKYKRRAANALSLKVLDRVICMASNPGDLVFDPFGGSGTTFVAAELLGRRWIGSELECGAIVSRFSALDGDREYIQELHQNKNTLFRASDLAKRAKSGIHPLSKSYRIPANLPFCDCPQKESEQPSLFSLF